MTAVIQLGAIAEANPGTRVTWAVTARHLRSVLRRRHR